MSDASVLPPCVKRRAGPTDLMGCHGNIAGARVSMDFDWSAIGGRILANRVNSRQVGKPDIFVLGPMCSIKAWPKRRLTHYRNLRVFIPLSGVHREPDAARGTSAWVHLRNMLSLPLSHSRGAPPKCRPGSQCFRSDTRRHSRRPLLR